MVGTRQDMTIHDKTRQNMTRHDKTRQDTTRHQDKTRQDKTRQDTPGVGFFRDPQNSINSTNRDPNRDLKTHPNFKSKHPKEFLWVLGPEQNTHSCFVRSHTNFKSMDVPN